MRDKITIISTLIKQVVNDYKYIIIAARIVAVRKTNSHHQRMLNLGAHRHFKKPCKPSPIR